MTDRRQIPMDTTEGWQPGPSGGERILVALAILALFGGLLIVAGNLLPKDEVAATASASPGATARPSPAPSTTPAPLDVRLQSAPLPSAVPPTAYFYGWMRATTELDIHADPRLDSVTVRVLAAGELFEAYEDPASVGQEGWASVSAATYSGWVATREGGVDRVTRYGPAPTPVSGSIWDLAAGPDGFLGIASAPGMSDAWPGPTLIRSVDGTRWKLARDQPDAALSPGTPAWGPAGWVMVSSGADGSTWVSTSSNGFQWSVRGTLVLPGGQPYPNQVVASPAGYLFHTATDRSSWRETLFFSVDAVNWHEVDAGLGHQSIQIAGTPLGFYAWNTDGCCPVLAAFSTDGFTWSPVTGGPRDIGLQFAATDDRWFATEMDRATGSVRAWLGTVVGGQLTWQLMPLSAAPFEDAVVTRLVATGDEAIAFGWDRSSAAPLTWVITGERWSRAALPDDFDGIPRVAAAGPRGVVLVGYQPSGPYENPRVWRRTDDGTWLPEADPLLAAITGPSTDQCAPPPTDALEFVLVDRGTAAFCYGSRSISFRAWSSRCDGCWGTSEVVADPKWLVQPGANTLWLAPIESASSSTTVVLPPSFVAEPADEWLGAWLELTGHFDDPAAAGCTYEPPPEELPYWSGRLSVIESCRQQFVVTAVQVVDGP